LFNARSVVSKISELHYLLYQVRYDVYFITETWLHDDVCSGLLDPQSQFTVLRKDRTVSKGGGVCALIRNHLRVVPVNIANEFLNLELLCFDLIIANSRYRFFVVYRPPGFDSDAINYMSLLVTCISKYSNDKYTNIILGDFNLPKVDWSTNCGPKHDVYAKFLTFVLENSYSQIVHFPTRDANILDLILTNDASLFTVVNSDLPVGTSDHSSVKFEVILPIDSHVPSLNTVAVKYKWHLGDYEGMNTFLSDINWYSVIYSHPSAHDAWNAFRNILYFAVDSFVPRVEHPSSNLRIRHGGYNSRDISKCASRKKTAVASP